ncbi:MAG: J domain-containing protein [Synergistaceae bacterium]|jgi:hypothetical protein|nr:J domain-containing protein [Synergistaceae bacterium]
MSGSSLHDHYFALDLSPGASPEEVRSAYRRLVKLYHPDKDASLDAEVRYRQIRAAYEVLMKNSPSPPSPHSDPWPPEARARKASREDRGGGAGREWRYAKDAKDKEYDPFWHDVIYGEERRARRIPFSLAALPQIFMASLAELANVGVVLQTLIAALFIGYAVPSRFPMSHRLLVWAFALASGLTAVVLRYYVTPRRKANLAKFVALGYALGVELFMTLLYREKWRFGSAFVSFLFAALFLILNPLGALFDAIRDVKNFHKGQNP